jgi:hypothetical protein
MHGRGPGRWLVLVLLGTLTALPALGWIGSPRATGGNGVHDAAGLFFSLTSPAAVPVSPAPAAPAPEPRGPTGASSRLVPPGPPAG